MPSYLADPNMLALIAERSKGPDLFGRRQAGEELGLQRGKAMLDLQAAQQQQTLRNLQIKEAKTELDERSERKKRLKEIEEDYKTYEKSKKKEGVEGTYQSKINFYRKKYEDAMLSGDEKLAKAMEDRISLYSSWKDQDSKTRDKIAAKVEKEMEALEEELISLSRGYLNAQKEGRGQEYLEQNVPELRNKYKNSEMLDGLPEDYTDSEFWTNQSVDTLVEADKLREGSGSKRLSFSTKYGTEIPASIVEKEWKQSKRNSELWMTQYKDPMAVARDYGQDIAAYQRDLTAHTSIIEQSMADFAYTNYGADITGRYTAQEKVFRANVAAVQEEWEDLDEVQAGQIVEDLTRSGISEMGGYTYTLKGGQIDRTLMDPSLQEESGLVQPEPETTPAVAVDGGAYVNAQALSSELQHYITTKQGGVYVNPHAYIDRYIDSMDVIKATKMLTDTHRQQLNQSFIGFLNKDIQKANERATQARTFYEERRQIQNTLKDERDIQAALLDMRAAEIELRRLKEKKDKLLMN